MGAGTHWARFAPLAMRSQALSSSLRTERTPRRLGEVIRFRHALRRWRAPACGGADKALFQPVGDADLVEDRPQRVLTTCSVV